MTDAAQALDQLGELIDQLASNAREFDFDTANRMERDAAKALLVIEVALAPPADDAGEAEAIRTWVAANEKRFETWHHDVGDGEIAFDFLVTTLRLLDAERARRVEVEGALAFYADESNYIETTLPLDMSQETRKQAPRIGADCGRRAQNALAGKPARLTPTEASDARRVREVVPELIEQLRSDATKMKTGPERIHVLAASNWLDSLLSRLSLRSGADQ